MTDKTNKTESNRQTVKTFKLKKKWIVRIESVKESLKPKCIMAIYEYMVNGVEVEALNCNMSLREFFNDFKADLKEDERRREELRKRREERKRKAEEERRQSETNIQKAEKECFIGSSEEYNKCPSLFIFDAFMHYLLSSSGAGMRPKMPAGKSLGDALMKFRKWAVETAKVNDISKLNVFRDQFVRNLALFE